MTYFAFLLAFILPVLATLAVLAWQDERRRPLPVELNSWPYFRVISLHVVIAFVYTTPWDNYLVYSGVWWYPENSVLAVIGYVPIEEYAFFVLQTVLVALWMVFLIRRHVGNRAPFRARTSLRIGGVAALGMVWIISAWLLLAGTDQWNYLTLILVWAIPPLMIQFGYGADVLWHHRRLVLLSVLPPGLYLSLADTVAIRTNTWIISSTQSTGVEAWPGLPIEEFTFFFVTTMLVVFGSLLALAEPVQQRLPAVLQSLLRRVSGRSVAARVPAEPAREHAGV